MDKSWMREDRLSDAYEVGVKQFFRFVKDHLDNCDTILCPCIRCGNFLAKTLSEVKGHLFQFGIDLGYSTWVLHGEESPSNTSNPGVNAQNVERQQFEMGLPDDALDAVEMVEAAYEEFIDDPQMFQKLVEDAEKPLYPSCKRFTKLSALVKLYNLKASGAWSDKSFSELLKLLKDMLPDNNEIPISFYEAKKTLNALGMEYEKIHACPNDCVLYKRQHSNAVKCPTCNVSRWKINKHMKESIGVPAKVLWYFPPIPRFKKMFRSVETSKELTWHHRPRVNDGRLRHPADSPTWKFVDHKWPDFAKESRNLRLALSADGINPHSSLSSRYSCWPVIMVTYNLPPWLCMKRKFMMLTTLISGPQQSGNDIDVYLRPLVDDLNILWDVGVAAYDAYKQQSFTLKVVMLWTVNDFPAYGILCGCTVKGYNACPICSENTFSTRLKYSKKISYMGHRRFLPSKHSFRKQKKAFNGEQEDGHAPDPLSGEEIFRMVENLENSWGKKKSTSEASTKKRSRDSGKKGKMITPYGKKYPIFMELPYWKYLLVRHCLDFMHITKNVGESIVGTLLNIPGKTKDDLNSRKDLVEMG